MTAFSKNDPQVVVIGSMTLFFNAIVFIGLGYQTVYSTLDGLILTQPLADVCSIIMVYVLSKRQKIMPN